MRRVIALYHMLQCTALYLSVDAVAVGDTHAGLIFVKDAIAGVVFRCVSSSLERELESLLLRAIPEATQLDGLATLTYNAKHILILVDPLT